VNADTMARDPGDLTQGGSMYKLVFSSRLAIDDQLSPRRSLEERVSAF
jgi:hypothetical protein